MTSAYPRSVADLVPDARKLASELGHTPSRNKLMSSLRIGRDKANAILAALADTDPTPAGLDTDAPRRLHAVPDASTTPADNAEPTETESATPGSAEAADPDTSPAPGAETETGGAADSPVTAVSDTAPGPDTDPGADQPATPPAADHGAGESAQPAPAPAPEPATPPTPASPAVTVPAAGGVRRPVRTWPLVLLAAPAFVAIWGGWVGLGALTGFGPVHLLPGIASGFSINSAITLPIGVETYAAYALRVWLAAAGPVRAQRFARTSAIGSLLLGALGQVAYHLMTAAHLTAAPWPITTVVSCLPVVVLGFGAALAHLQRHPAD